MQIVRNQTGHIARTLLIGMIGIILPAVIMIVVYKDRKFERPINNANNPHAQVAPRSSEMPPAIKLGGEELELFRLPGPLSQTPIYTIQIDNNSIWLGTGKGLIRFIPAGGSKLYRNFSRSPNESIQALTKVNDKLAASIMIASDNGPDTPVGSYLFDPATESWQEIGGNASSLSWDGARLWAIQGRTLSTIIKQTDGSWQQQKVLTDNRLCSTGEIALAAGSLWITQQGTEQLKPKSNWAPEARCGVLRLNPKTNDETLFTEEHGLSSALGRAIVTDEREVWVAHSSKASGLSRFSFAQQQWTPLTTDTSSPLLYANAIGMSVNAVWLGTPDAPQPLTRLDRSSLELRSINETPPGYDVTAIDSHADTVWVALSKKTAIPGGNEAFRVETIFGRIRE